MASERVTIQVESNIGEDGPLTVGDVLRQILDAFDLIAAAIAQEPGGDTIKWRLVAMSKNSPATATAEAYSTDPTILPGPLAFRGKRRFVEGMDGLSHGRVEPWLSDRAILAKQFLKRNLNGVGKTVIDLEDDLPRAVIVERVARSGLQAIERAEAEKQNAIADLSRTEWGSIEANVAEAKTYHSQPALYVKERLSQSVIPCVLSEEAASEAGPTHSWDEVWKGKRVRIEGQIFYDRAGKISRVRARRIVDIHAEPVNLTELRQVDILQGDSPTEFLDRLWEGRLG